MLRLALCARQGKKGGVRLCCWHQRAGINYYHSSWLIENGADLLCAIDPELDRMQLIT